MPVVIGPTIPLQRNAELGTTVSGTSATQPTTAPAAAAAFAQKLSAQSTRRVEATRTPISAAVAESAIADAYSKLTGSALSDSGRAILTAQWAHETGHGASMFNFNFGGIKGVGPSGMTVAQRTREGFGSTERQIVDNFRAYASVEEGAKDYVQLLLARYGSAVSAAERGDAASFVQGLKQKGYFTGDPAAYERSITSTARRIAGSSSALALENTPAEQGVRQPAAAASANLPSLEIESSHRRGMTGSLEIESSYRRGMTSSLAEWQREPMPSALLGLSNRSTSEASWDGIPDLSSVRALDMSDEVTRAALRIALADGDEKRRK